MYEMTKWLLAAIIILLLILIFTEIRAWTVCNTSMTQYLNQLLILHENQMKGEK